MVLDLYRHKSRSDDAWNVLASALIGDEKAEEPPHVRAKRACRNPLVLIIIEGAEEADGRDGHCTLREQLGIYVPQNSHLVLTGDPTQAHPTRTLSLTQKLDGTAAAAVPTHQNLQADNY
jgi:hypothetical protein